MANPKQKGRPKHELTKGIGNLLPVGLVVQALDVSRQALTKWQEEGFPKTEDGLVDSLDVIKYLRKKIVEQREEETAMSGSDSPNLERYRAARASMEEMNVAERKGELLQAKEVQRYWKTVLANVWGQVQRFRDNLPPLLINKTGSQIREVIIEETERAGKQIVEELEKLKGTKK